MIKKYILFTILVVIIALLIIWVVYGNSTFDINTINVSSESLPMEFDGFRIAQISDLHNAEFGKDNIKLISLLKKVDADIIIIAVGTAICRFSGILFRNFQAKSLKTTHDCNNVGL